MPRYVVHVFNDETSLDEEGRELPNLQAARAHAIEDARSLMSDTLRKGRLVLSRHIAIQNDRGELLLDVKFGDAVEVRL
ncbi:MAG TPA: hypothetical protein VFZ91_01015 [Allosphingosinicella sp.]